MKAWMRHHEGHAVVVIWLVLALVLLASPAVAQKACAPHDATAKLLLEKYKEQPVGMGLTSGGNVAEIYMSKAGTWTVTVTNPNGQTCMIQTGVGWEEREFKEIPEGDAL